MLFKICNVFYFFVFATSLLVNKIKGLLEETKDFEYIYKYIYENLENL